MTGAVEAELSVAQALIDAGNPGAARHHLDKILAETPNHALALTLMAMTWLEDAPPRAAELARLALSAAPHQVIGLRVLGLAQAELGMLEEAEVSLDKARELDAEDPWTWFGISVVASKRNSIPEALSAIRKARKLAPDNGVILAFTAMLEIDNRMLGNAAACAIEAAEKAPNHPLPHIASCWVAIRSGNMALAREHLDTATRLSPNYRPVRLMLVRFELIQRPLTGSFWKHVLGVHKAHGDTMFANVWILLTIGLTALYFIYGFETDAAWPVGMAMLVPIASITVLSRLPRLGPIILRRRLKRTVSLNADY